MKNQKGISSSDDKMDKEFFDTISAINNGLDKLDSMDTYVPDDKWFERMVLDQQVIQKKKYRRELAWFILSAVLILSGVIFTMLELPILFFVLQAVTVAITAIYSYKGVQKQVDSR
ncbi:MULTISPECIES: YxlC family protein [Mesobacillus]|uniref:YxlC family protein n=1 Tax=Mesobacillus TaxID=2675231 RepID=UPI001780C44D|nr:MULTISPECIES: YxlC family protein [Mesobacillus]MCM3573397.1 YxlC family protein [Mesobacillus subterraneus]UYZ23064.1 YxlC family protein [Mesobacillus jeotgali]